MGNSLTAETLKHPIRVLQCLTVVQALLVVCAWVLIWESGGWWNHDHSDVDLAYAAAVGVALIGALEIILAAGNQFRERGQYAAVGLVGMTVAALMACAIFVMTFSLG